MRASSAALSANHYGAEAGDSCAVEDDIVVESVVRRISEMWQTPCAKQVLEMRPRQEGRGNEIMQNRYKNFSLNSTSCGDLVDCHSN